MIAFTHHCGVCGEDIKATVVFDHNRIQFIVPPCKPCIDEAMAQGEAMAIVDKVTKGEDLE